MSERAGHWRGRAGMRAACAIVLLSGCLGGLSNQPLQVGKVQGRLDGPGAAGAQVFVLGHPELHTVAGADGSFTIEQVPVASSVNVVASAAQSAVVFTLSVGGGQAAQAGEVALLTAGGIVVHAEGQGGATVSVAGTPLAAALDADGRARLGALPDDCYQVQLALASGTRTLDACLSGGQDTEVELEDSGSTSGSGSSGGSSGSSGSSGSMDCRSAGCSGGTVCDPGDGQCYACVLDTDCDGQSVCHAHACVAPLVGCAGCIGDWQCGRGGACVQPFADAGSQCAFACHGDSDCSLYGAGDDYGYRCVLGRCEAQLDEIGRCDGATALGAGCNGDDDCRRAGLIDGHCDDQQHTCTVECGGSGDCPDGWSCDVDGGSGCHL